MEHSDLYLLLKTLDLGDMDDLESFIQCEFTGKARYRSQVKTLFQILRAHISSESKQELDKEALYADIFPDQSVSVSQVERVMHELLQIVRRFLLYQQYFAESNARPRQIHYAAILRSKGLESKAMIQVNHALKEIEGVKVRGASHFSTGFDAAWLQYSLSSKNTKWKDDLQITSTIKHLDLHYLCHKLQLVNHYLVLNAVSKVSSEEDMPMIDPGSIKPEYLEQEPYLKIAYKSYLLLSNPNPTKAGFEELYGLVSQFEPGMDEETIRLSYSYLRNYCILLIRSGHQEFNSLLFSILVDNLKKGYFFYEGKITLGTYYNISNIAIREKRLDWAYGFLQQYKEAVHGNQEDRDETYNLILAQYYHRMKAYDKAISYLPQSSQNLLRNLPIKTLEIMIYYDQESELFQYKLDAFKMHISRSSKKLISEEARKWYANFINFLAQISNTAVGDQERIGRITSRIQGKTYVGEREWLLEKVEEINRKVK